MPSPTHPEVHPRLGSVLRIDERTVLLTGQELDVAAGQPDVANVLLHRVGDTLYMIDTGVTTRFRQALVDALDLVGPWNRLTVLITDGHPDHVGNNDLVDELADQRGIEAELVVPAADVAQMRDPQAYWRSSFNRLAGLAALPAAPSLAAIKIASLFQPYHPFGRRTRTYEQTAPQAIILGRARFVGWSFSDGAVSVLPSQGHCAGHVVVYLRDSKLLHLGDEANGPCAVMHDADQVKLTAIQTATRQLIDDGEVELLVDGHSFEVQDADTALTRVDRLLEQNLVLQSAAAALVAGASVVDGSDFARGFTQSYRDRGVAGANVNAVFLGMMAASQLQRMGFTRGELSTQWRAPTFAPAASTTRTAARVVTGIAASAGWRARGLQRAPR